MPGPTLSLDELIKQQGTDRAWDNPGHAQAEAPAQDPGFYDPADMQGPADDGMTSDTAARSQGRMAAKTIDGILGGVMANYAHESDSSRYRANRQELQDLEDGWTEVAKMYPIKIDPRVNLAIMYWGTYWKYFSAARDDRRINEIKQAQEEQAVRIANLEKQAAEKKS